MESFRNKGSADIGRADIRLVSKVPLLNNQTRKTADIPAELSVTGVAFMPLDSISAAA